MNKLFTDNSIGELLRKIDTKELTPEALLDTATENISTLDSTYLAWEVYREKGWVAPTPGAAMDFVPMNEKGLLRHIPIGVKDIYNTYDFPTQMGSTLWKGFTPGNDARAVYNLKRQGAKVVGKTVTAEFAVHALEKTKNPWDETKTPGTSSSGSAVAVSLGQVPLATGTQTAGSIIRPASFCGVYGMKPSFGLIPRTGMLKTTDSLDTPGFFTIYQTDLKRALDSMRISGRNYPISDSALSDETRQKKPTNRKWRVGFVRTHTWDSTPEYARQAIELYIKELGADTDIEITDVTLPEIMKQTHVVHETIYNKALSYYFQNEYKEAEKISPIMNELIEKGKLISVKEYQHAVNKQMEMLYAMDDYLKDFDVLISLSTAGEAPDRDKVELPDPALMWTLTHLPAVSVPQFSSPSGLPFGMQVVARKYNDYLLLNFLDYLREKKHIPEKAGYAISHPTN